MTTLTDNAVAAIRLLAQRQAPPRQPKIRIATDGESGQLTVDLVSSPKAGDAVFDRDGTRLYLDQETARLMDGKALDAVTTPVGRITFSLQDQAKPRR